MSTNTNKYGANMWGYSHVFVSPKWTRTLPVFTVRRYDENDNYIGDELVDVDEYFRVTNAATGQNRVVLEFDTHYYAPFNSSNQDIIEMQAKVEAVEGLIWHSDDVTQTGENAVFLIGYNDFQNKFYGVNPISVRAEQ